MRPVRRKSNGKTPDRHQTAIVRAILWQRNGSPVRVAPASTRFGRTPSNVARMVWLHRDFLKPRAGNRVHQQSFSPLANPRATMHYAARRGPAREPKDPACL
jgi:hypothetical protein